MAANSPTPTKPAVPGGTWRAICIGPGRWTIMARTQRQNVCPLWRSCFAFVFLAIATSIAFAQNAPICRVASIEGEVRAGQAFEHPIGNGLEIMLEPLVSGWIVRVLPAHGPRGQHDYAELATPPYRSVSPLLISTDYSFRAQDALAWTPRHFRFAADRSSFLALQHWYDEYERDTSGLQARRTAESKLVQLAAHAPEAELTILDAHLVQGTADQAGTAAMVASHLNASAHEVDQPADGKSTPLGRLVSLRFLVRFDLPKGFSASGNLAIKKVGCI
jgi:hypothetical protein